MCSSHLLVLQGTPVQTQRSVTTDKSPSPGKAASEHSESAGHKAASVAALMGSSHHGREGLGSPNTPEQEARDTKASREHTPQDDGYAAPSKSNVEWWSGKADGISAGVALVHGAKCKSRRACVSSMLVVRSMRIFKLLSWQSDWQGGPYVQSP